MRVLQGDITVRQLLWLAIAMVVAVVVLGLGCSLIGHVRVPLDSSLLESQIWLTRVFRLLAAAVVGAALAGSGLALQALLRNPLADPYILGVASGAGVGVLAGKAMGAGLWMAAWLVTPATAFVGALAAVITVYLIARRAGHIDPYVMLLSGVIVNVFNGAIMFTLILFVQQADLIHFIGWGMGQLPEYLWFEPALLIVAAILASGGLLVLLRRCTAYNVLSLGDDVARSSGVSIGRLRVETFIVVSLMTVAAVALAGPIGFVGLIVPHICRLIAGPDHRRLLILCAGGGAMFLMAADTLCRLIGFWLRLGEMPVGVICALIGGPLFIYLLKTQFRNQSV